MCDQKSYFEISKILEARPEKKAEVLEDLNSFGKTPRTRIQKETEDFGIDRELWTKILKKIWAMIFDDIDE